MAEYTVESGEEETYRYSEIKQGSVLNIEKGAVLNTTG